MKAEIIKEQDKTYIANTYARYDLLLTHGKGATLYGEGKEYIDFGSGIAVNIFGAGDKEWADAVTLQVNRLAHTSNLYYTEPGVELAKQLCDRAGSSKVFFSNSGAEANECAIKAARKYSYDKYGKDRYEIITLNNSFHGRTIATLTATAQQEMHNYFFPFLEGFVYADANYADVSNKITDKTAAIMIELVQGEGGVIPLDPAFVNQIAEICCKKDILLIIDEVQTGNGRTGSLFAYMQYGIIPDIVTTAKGLGGGLPIGASLFFEKTANVLTSGVHGSTFGANLVATAGAISILSRLDDKLLNEVKIKGDYIKNSLKECSIIKSITGLGLMLGIEVEGNAKELLQQCMQKGLLVLTAKQKLRLLPPLNITYDELDKGLKILKEVLS